VIPRRFTLLLGLLLALPGPQSLPAAQQAGDYALTVGRDRPSSEEKSPGGSDRAEYAGGRLQLASALGKDVPLWLEDAWQKNPQDLQLGLALLQHYHKQQDTTRMLDLVRKLYAAHPGNTDVLKAFVITLLDSGDTGAALEQADRLTQLQPNSPDAWYLLGLANIKKPDNAAAHRALERAVALDPTHFLTPLEAQARLYLREEQYKEALEIARTLKTRFPTVATGYRLEGDAYAQQREFAKAVPAFQTAFSKAPSMALALALANAYWQTNNQADAFKTLKSWLASNPKDILARTVLVTYLDSLQRYPEAIAEAETIWLQEPDNGIVLSNLATLYQQVGDKRALELAERAIRLAPDSPEVADTLGWILVQSNQLPRGLELIRQAMAQKPDNPVIAYHLAAAYAKAGQREAALQELSIVTQLIKLAQDKPSLQLMEDMKKLQESLQQK